MSTSSNGARPDRTWPTHYTRRSVLLDAPAEPGDEQVGAYSYEQRIRMNDRFVSAVERAIAAGDEQPWWQRKRDLG